jgi:pimeloyl-ACP methyl ester carboxylesterase
MIYRQPVVHEFPNIKAPTLVVIGQKDKTTLGRGFVAPDVIKTMGNYPELGKKTAQAIPGAKLVEFDNVGHIPHLESPDEFHQALLQFLEH